MASKDIVGSELKDVGFWYEGTYYSDPRAINWICERYVDNLVKLGKYVSIEKHREEITQLKQQAIQEFVERILNKKKTIAVHGGTDSFYPSKHIEAVPITTIQEELKK